MRNLKDERTKIFPQLRGEVRNCHLASSALDSPSIMSKFATPTPAIDSDRSHVIDDATSAMHDAYDETTSLLNNDNVPFGEFLDKQTARVI